MANLLGTASNDTMIGADSVNDRLDGDAGSDLIFGYGSVAGGIGLPVPPLDPAGGGNTDNDFLIGGFGNDTIHAGGGDDNVQGGDGLDQLFGDDGNDALDGGFGADKMAGGKGDDSYVVHDAGDKVTELAGGGEDGVTSWITYTLPSEVEHLFLEGLDPINGTGNDLENFIVGNNADNILDGKAGGDEMDGRGGNDTYIVDSVLDMVAEAFADARGGTDIVLSSVSYKLGFGIENLTLTGAAAINGSGNELANVITGNAAANILDGGIGSDTLIGGGGNDVLTDTGGGDPAGDRLDGGVGADTMNGGDGDDIYIVDNAKDVVDETTGSGTDTVQTSISFSLVENGVTVKGTFENLTLTGTGGISGTGNDVANLIAGNSGANVLDGGEGADTLEGGKGNDTYLVDNSSDIVVEIAGGGIDSVKSTASYTLTDPFVENLTLLAGAGNISATGNALANTLTGSEGNNTLDGGTGNDSMAGGAGNDTYVVDSAGDKISETLAGPAGGNDTVESRISYTLGNNLEDLVLTGTDDINGTGNSLGNAMLGNSGDNVLNGLAGVDSLAGGDGDDTYVLDVIGDVVTEDPGKGNDTVQAPFSIDLKNYANVENATLLGTGALSATGDDNDNKLTGNTGANTLTGNGGGDILDGGKGNDSMVGGAGNDVYVVDSLKDAISETGGDAGDEIRSFITLSLTAFANIENLALLGTAAINGTGDGNDNIITGNTGNNSLDGGAGSDSMDGGKGNDTYLVDVGTDQVSETAGGGIDTVISKATFTLGAGSNIENLTLTGGLDIDATGNELANILTGNDGKNLLDGGTGADKMAGGKNDDTYIVDNVGDTVTETLTAAMGGGHDLVKSSVSFTLGNNVDDLELTGTGNINGTGNALANTITGNSGNNVLNGLGGADTLIGGDGDDSYLLDVAGDQVTEDPSKGDDTVQASFAIELKNYANVENAILLGTAGLSATGDGGDNKLTGNTGANTLIGNGGNDTLDGGKGNDSMVGGTGDDVYFVDSATDRIGEGPGEGNDEVRSSITLSLATFANVELLTLLGTAAVNGTGNAGDNIITGNDGNNSLAGGDGADTLNGGSGNDTLAGGSGSNLLAGGDGNDTYVITGAGTDTISGTSGKGTDTVLSTIDFSLAALPDIENLTLTGAAVSGTGNDGKNVITGNDGHNTLDGGGDDDTMAGGKGNDTYVVDSGSDVINEAANAGTDTVLNSAPNYVLGANIENLALTGSSNIGGTGNTLANKITGNDGDNILNGAAGNDTLDGGMGHDTLNGGTGTDTYLYAGTDGIDVVNTDDNGVDHVVLVGIPYDWDVTRDGNDLLIQFVLDRDAEYAGFDPTHAIRIVNQYAGAPIASFGGDFGSFNALYGGNPDFTTVFTPVGLNGKDQGANVEVVEGTDNGETINGGGGQSDFLYGNGGNDRINGQSGNGDSASMFGGTGDDTLIGGVGDDRLVGDEGDDSLDGGAGNDQVNYRMATDAVLVDLTKQGQPQHISDSQGTDTFINVEDGEGGAFNDTLIGTSDFNSLRGLDGNDSLLGNGGSDFLVGDAGNDTVEGSAIGDFAEASYEHAKVGAIINLSDVTHAGVAAHTAEDGQGGTDTLVNIQGALGGDFGDQFFGADNVDDFFEPMGGNDTASGGGGTGFDDIDFFSSTDAVVASLAMQGAPQTISASQGTDVYTGFEGLDGSAFNDTLSGDGNGNFLQGRGGNDSLFGGFGDDNLRGGTGNDTLNGGGGFDRADYFQATSGVHVDLSHQGVLQAVGGGEGSDLLLNISALRGGAFNDTLIGDDNGNTMIGLAGNDSLSGGAGGDFLIGGAGNDILRGILGDFVEASYGDASTGVIVNLSSTTQLGAAAGHAFDGSGGTDTLINIQGVFGSAFGDHFFGGNSDEFFEGMGGNDTIDGGGGFNALSYFSSDDGVHVDLNIQGGAGQFISASQGTDVISNIIDVYGSLHDDDIVGNAADNFLLGRDGNDTLVGGAGPDTLTGGVGVDTFQVSLAASAGRDVITDFNLTSDVLKFQDVLDVGAPGLDLSDLNAAISSVTDGGSHGNVTVSFINGASIVFQGVGNGAVNSIDDLVVNPAAQIVIT